MFHFLKRPLSGFCVGFPTVERSHMAVEALLSLSRAVLCFTFALRLTLFAGCDDAGSLWSTRSCDTCDTIYGIYTHDA